jgi:hypothetical protein
MALLSEPDTLPGDILVPSKSRTLSIRPNSTTRIMARGANRLTGREKGNCYSVLTARNMVVTPNRGVDSDCGTSISKNEQNRKE